MLTTNKLIISIDVKNVFTYYIIYAYVIVYNRSQCCQKGTRNLTIAKRSRVSCVMYTVLSSLAACGRLGVAAAGVLFWHAAS